MPKDEDHKKFKAVTEELTNSPATHETESTETPEISEKNEIEEKATDVGTLHVQETDNISTDIKVKHKNSDFLKIFVVTFFATLLAFLLAGGIYVYLTGTKTLITDKSISNQTSIPQATQTPEPSSTPVATTDFSTFKISVLNGNGGIGVASALKNIIEKVGFKVSNLSNADNFNFTDTIIQVKSTVADDVVAKLKDSLSSNYSVKVGDQLDAKSTFDIVITVGSK